MLLLQFCYLNYLTYVNKLTDTNHANDLTHTNNANLVFNGYTSAIAVNAAPSERGSEAASN